MPRRVLEVDDSDGGQIIKKGRTTVFRVTDAPTNTVQLFALPRPRLLLVRVYSGGSLSIQSGPFFKTVQRFHGRAHFNVLTVELLRKLRWGPVEYCEFFRASDAHAIIAHPLQGVDPYLENWNMRFMRKNIEVGLRDHLGSPSILEINQDCGAFSQVTATRCVRLNSADSICVNNPLG